MCNGAVEPDIKQAKALQWHVETVLNELLDERED
jgi:hypothetical protein